MKQLNINFKTTVIIILNILLFIIIIYGLFYKNKNKEGFNPNDITKALNKVGDITKTMDQIPKQLEDMGKKIEENTINVLTKKLTSIFTQLGDMFYQGLILPLFELFKAIGQVFEQFGNILMTIGNKIGSLPGCIIIYAIQSTIDTIFFIYRKLVPGFIRSYLSIVYDYTLGYVFGFIGWLTGYTAAVKSCYGFNVSDEVKRINKGFSNAGESFTKNFGKLDFTKIRI
jgi:hypothetical protein